MYLHLQWSRQEKEVTIFCSSLASVFVMQLCSPFNLTCTLVMQDECNLCVCFEYLKQTVLYSPLPHFLICLQHNSCMFSSLCI